MKRCLEKVKKNKDGFTLVELIVVLVILAILISMLVPSLTGYIDKANEKSALLECRQVVLAAQVEASDQYGRGVVSFAFDLAQIKEMAEVTGTITTITSADGKITYVRYVSKKGIVVIYENDAYRIEGKEEGSGGGGSGEEGDGGGTGGNGDDTNEPEVPDSGDKHFVVDDKKFGIQDDVEDLYQKWLASSPGAEGVQLTEKGVYKVGDTYYYNWGAYYHGGTHQLNGGGAIVINTGAGIKNFNDITVGGAITPGNVYEYNGKYYVALNGAGKWDQGTVPGGDCWGEISPVS